MAEYRVLKARLDKKLDKISRFRDAEKERTQERPVEIGFVSQK